MSDIAVVTAVAGDYDYIGSHSHYQSDVDYIFFTDGKSLPKDPQWEIHSLPEISVLDPRRLAKFPKLNPHYFKALRFYDYVIWIDGSMQIIHDHFIDEIMNHMDDGLVLSPHFDGRDCGYGEATIRPQKYVNEPLDAQCDFYRKEGFPEHFGLWEAGLHARCMRNPLVKTFGEIWLDENLAWSYQDQVSLGYSLWKSGLVPEVLPKSFRDYSWVHLNAHKSED
jgi:hypothetical protein